MHKINKMSPPVNSVHSVNSVKNSFFSLLYLLPLCAMLSAPCALATDLAPRDIWYIDYNNPSTHKVEIRRSSTLILEPTVRQNGTAVDLTEATNVWLAYKASGATNYYALTGTVYNATAGVCRLRWTSANETTNTALIGDIYICSPTSTAVRCPLAITLTADATYNSAATTNPTPRTSIDWLTVLNLNIGSAPFLGTTNRTLGDTWYYDGTNIVRLPIGSTGYGLLVSGGKPTWGVVGMGDMSAAIFDPAGLNTQLESRANFQSHTGKVGTAAHSLGTAAQSNATVFANSAQGAKADTALQSEADTNALAQLNTHTGLQATAHGGIIKQSDTNGWQVGSHGGFLTSEADTNALAQLIIETNRAQQAEAALVSKSDTNGWTVSTHAGLALDGNGTNYFRDISHSTNWTGAVVDGPLDFRYQYATNLQKMYIGTSTSAAQAFIRTSNVVPFTITSFAGASYSVNTFDQYGAWNSSWNNKAVCNIGWGGGGTTPGQVWLYDNAVLTTAIRAGTNKSYVSGFFGCGTNHPATTLDVNGNTILRGSLTNSGAFLIGAGTNQLTLGQGGPVVITGNLSANGAGITNNLFSLPWQIEQPTNTTRYYLIYQAADKSGNLEKISGCVTSGVVGFDVCIADSTNGALSVSTINYTGAYFATAMSNIVLDIAYTNRQRVYLSITNGYGLQFIGGLEARE